MEVLEFFQACKSGDLEALEALLLIYDIDVNDNVKTFSFAK